MSDLDIETVIDKLLVFLVDEMEENGDTTSTSSFDFGPSQRHRTAFLASYMGLEELLMKAVNVCISRRYLRHTTIGSEYNDLGLTTSGHARALSVKNKKPEQPVASTVNIGVLTSHAPMQIGNGNTMTIAAFQEAALAGIEASDAPPDQKADAKGLLAKVLEHPLLCSVLGGIAGGVTSGVMGTGGRS